MRLFLLIVLFLIGLFSPPLEAVRRNPDGHGDVLIVPYYSVRSSRITLLAIANQRAVAKAIKVRVRESHFGKLLLQFNLYLAPHDRWVATLFEQEGRMNIGTSDRSCTVPDLIGDAHAARIGALAYWPASNQDFIGEHADAAGTDWSRTLEGSIEIFEMGEVLPGNTGSAQALAFTGADQAQSIPNNCGQLQRAFNVDGGNQGYWSIDPTRDIGPARGGLSAEASVVHVPVGFSFEIPVVGLSEFRALHAPVLHTPPTSAHPDLDDALSEVGSGEAHAWVTDQQGQNVQLRYPRTEAIDAVSAVLAVPGLQGAYSKWSAIGGGTDWVLAQPTRRFYQHEAPYSVENGGAEYATLRWLGRQGGPGFEQGTSGCEIGFECPYGSVVWHQVAIPVLTFNRGAESVVGAVAYGQRTAFSASTGSNPAPEEGSLLLAFGWVNETGGARYFSLRPDLNGRRVAGLPVIAFAVMAYETATATATPGQHAMFADTRVLPVFGPPFVDARGAP